MFIKIQLKSVIMWYTSLNIYTPSLPQSPRPRAPAHDSTRLILWLSEWEFAAHRGFAA